LKKDNPPKDKRISIADVSDKPVKRSRVTGWHYGANFKAQQGVKPNTQLFVNPKKLTTRLLIGIPTTGIIRYEWAIARWGQVIPINWSMAEVAQAFSQVGPIGYAVADARNIIVHTMLTTRDCDWLFFIDHDTIIPGDCFVKINQYIHRANEPIVCGLYYAKGNPPLPLVFRGRGNSYFADWKLGDKVRVDAVPMGCTLIHRSVLEESAKVSPFYNVPGIKEPIRKHFDTPRRIWYDPETSQYLKDTGTEDIYWCDKLLDNKILAKAGWTKLAKLKFPFLCDTSIFCKHIDVSTGIQYP